MRDIGIGRAAIPISLGCAGLGACSGATRIVISGVERCRRSLLRSEYRGTLLQSEPRRCAVGGCFPRRGSTFSRERRGGVARAGAACHLFFDGVARSCEAIGRAEASAASTRQSFFWDAVSHRAAMLVEAGWTFRKLRRIVQRHEAVVEGRNRRKHRTRLGSMTASASSPCLSHISECGVSSLTVAPTAPRVHVLHARAPCVWPLFFKTFMNPDAASAMYRSATCRRGL
ncbi:hypothetical protein SAMN05216525_16111 [Bradyrhizobium sp. Gha]|nr:hypothetical protein SAMN05216525_16111 [Bradyrhizobium sp. Gha]